MEILLLLAVGKKHNDPIWATAIDCRVWRSEDRGATWEPVDVPFAGQQLLALAIAPQDSTALLCSLTPQKNEMVLWRLQDVNGDWEQWLRQPLSQPYAQIAPAGHRAEQSWLVLDNEVWRHTGEGWQKVKTFEQTIQRIASNLAHDLLYVLVGQEVCYSKNGLDWASMIVPEEAGPLVDLQVVAGDKLLALDIKGVVWQASSG